VNGAGVLSPARSKQEAAGGWKWAHDLWADMLG
jgi:hypothetical protein